MKEEIKVPSMGESITEATIGQIIKAVGSTVKAEDELLELETDKATQVLYAPQGGIFQLNVKPGDVVTIGQVIGFVDTEGSLAVASDPVKLEPKVEPQQSPPVLSEGGARVTKEAYVEQLLEKKEAPAPEQKAPAPVVDGRRETRKKMSRIRQVIARRLVEVQQNTAMLTTFNEVDMSQILQLRSEYQEPFQKKFAVKLGFMSFFVKAVVAALKEFPDLNGYIEGDEIVYRSYYNISIAVGTERGLIVPVVRNCDQLSFAGIEKAIYDYAIKARDGTITPDDLQGGGFTITNGGIYGSLLSTPILNAPQSGILGMHKIEKRPVVVDDQIVIRPMMNLALSYDHRIVDGKEAVSFLVAVKKNLENPPRLLLEV